MQDKNIQRYIDGILTELDYSPSNVSIVNIGTFVEETGLPLETLFRYLDSIGLDYVQSGGTYGDEYGVIRTVPEDCICVRSLQDKKETALEYLEKVAEKICAEHQSGRICNHYGACEYVGPFVEYMQENANDAADFEAWAEVIGDHEKLYGAIFDGAARIDEAPEHHVSDVSRFHEICRAHGIEV